MNSPPVPVATPPEVVSPPEVPAPQTLVCENCGAPLTGEYCSACGQRHEPHVHTLSHFAGEAFESVTHADSRLWRTLGYLLTKPGRLSQEFFAGRRARQLPPFRLYLVISVFFFVVAGVSNVEVKMNDGPATAKTVEALKKTADGLEADAANTPGIAETVRQLREQAAREQAELEAEKKEATEDDESPQDAERAARKAAREASKPKHEHRDRVTVGFCEGVVDPGPNGSWGKRAFFGYCQKVSTMSGKALLEAMIHNLPKAMFVFLPLLAAVMKLLYWRPKRYYVEHLLFLIHNHAFVFLALAIMILAARIPGIGGQVAWLETAISLYMIWYIFRAMRVYYGQSRFMTFSKYVVIWFAYVMTSAIVLAGTIIYSTLML